MLCNSFSKFTIDIKNVLKKLLVFLGSTINKVFHTNGILETFGNPEPIVNVASINILDISNICSVPKFSS
jgi:hypothetical protein